MEQLILLGILIVIIILFSIRSEFNKLKSQKEYWKSVVDVKNKEIEKLTTDKYDLLIKNKECNKEQSNNRIKINELKKILNKYSLLFEDFISGLKRDSVLLPSLVRWTIKLQEHEDKSIKLKMINKKRPALKSAEEVSEARRLAREYKKKFELAYNQVDLYESLAPWLKEYTDLTLNELLDSLKIKKGYENFEYENKDPVSLYISKSEWDNLSTSERNQKALERYLDNKRSRSLWEIGIEYERFLGYHFEQLGYKVNYHGAINKKEDLGIDLVCENQDEVLVIQCKRLSEVKEIPVRENTIAQTYGSSEYYKMENNIQKKVIPMIITSYIISDKAKDFAKYLNVEVIERFKIKEFPRIKCNIGRDGRIYHLPMDQQYDKVIIGDQSGEFYAWTVTEAEDRGFRRAFKWKGN